MKTSKLTIPDFAEKPITYDLTDLKYLVVGTPRSGTGFMAKSFNQVGIAPVGHEASFGLGSQLLKKVLKVESSWLVVPYISNIKDLNPDIKVIHVIRDPMQTFRSLIRLGFYCRSCNYIWRGHNETKYEAFMQKFIPEDDGLVNFVIQWNKRAAELADYTYFLWDSFDNLMQKMSIEYTEENGLFNDKKYNHCERQADEDKAIKELAMDTSELEYLSNLYQKRITLNFYK